MAYQARLLDSVPYWYIAPFIPGFIGFNWAVALEIGWGIVPSLAIQTVIVGGIWWANRHAARQLWAEADGLPVVGEP